MVIDEILWSKWPFIGEHDKHEPVELKSENFPSDSVDFRLRRDGWPFFWSSCDSSVQKLVVRGDWGRRFPSMEPLPKEDLRDTGFI